MKHRIIYILALLFATMQTFAQTYTYDSNNRLTKVVYDNGTTITYTFDALGNRTGKKVTGSTAVKYTISVSVSPSGSGTVTGGGTYAKGTTIELNAIPISLFIFRIQVAASDILYNTVADPDIFYRSSKSLKGMSAGNGKPQIADIHLGAQNKQFYIDRKFQPAQFIVWVPIAS